MLRSLPKSTMDSKITTKTFSYNRHLNDSKNYIRDSNNYHNEPITIKFWSVYINKKWHSATMHL